LSKKTQRRVAVAALSFALGAASAIPAFAAQSDSGSTDAISSLGDTLSNLPYVSFLPGQDVASDINNAVGTVDGATNTVSDTVGGATGGIGGLVSSLPVVSGLLGGGGGGLPIVGSLPMVGGIVGTVGGLAGSLPVVGPMVSSLPIVNGIVDGAASTQDAVSSVTGAVGGVTGMADGLPLVGPIVASLPIVGDGTLASGLPIVGDGSMAASLPVAGPVVSSLPVAGMLGGLLGGLASDFLLRATGNRRLSRQGIAVAGMSACGTLVVLAYFVENLHVAVALMTLGAFAATFGGVSGYTVAIEFGGKRVATVFSVMNMCGNLGAAIVNQAVGSLKEHTGSWNTALFVIAGIFLVDAICWALLNPKGPLFGEPHDPR